MQQEGIRAKTWKLSALPPVPASVCLEPGPLLSVFNREASQRPPGLGLPSQVMSSHSVRGPYAFQKHILFPSCCCCSEMDSSLQCKLTCPLLVSEAGGVFQRFPSLCSPCALLTHWREESMSPSLVSWWAPIVEQWSTVEGMRRGF